MTGGTKKSIILESKDGLSTRPTTDKVKQAVFNMVQFEIEGKIALDLFCGSGALGIESLSRGAKKCVFVDLDTHIVKKNIEKTRLMEQSEIIRADYKDFLKKNNQKLSLIFLDPPYNKGILDDVLDSLYAHLLDNAIIIMECDKNEEIIIPEKYKIRKTAVYGRVKIIILNYEVRVIYENRGLSR